MELYTTAPNWIDEGILPKDTILFLTPESAWAHARVENWKSPMLYKVDIPEEYVKKVRDQTDVYRCTTHWDDIVPMPYKDPRSKPNGGDYPEAVRDRTRPPMPVINDQEKDVLERFTSRNPYGPSSPVTHRTDPPRTLRGPTSLNLQDMVKRFAATMRARTWKQP